MSALVDPIIGGIDIGDIASGCTCLRLRRASRRVSQMYDRALAPIGLNVGQFGMLGHLYGELAQTGSGLTVGVLAERLGMDPTTLNRNLKPLESLHLVESRRDPGDHRRRLVEISVAGQRKLGAATRLWREAQDDLVARLGADTTRTLNALLDRSVAVLVPP